MCQPLRPPDDDEDGSNSSSTSRSTSTASPSTSSPLPLRPLPLQFVAVGPGGTVPDPRTVRVHAIKEYHARKREAKRAGSEQVKLQRNSQLRPTKVTPKSGDVPGALLGRGVAADEEIGGVVDEAPDRPLTTRQLTPYVLPPSTKVGYRADCKTSCSLP